MFNLLSWISASLTVIGMYLVGRKLWYGWIVNLFILAYINYTFRLYGFLVLNGFLFILFMKNAVQWRYK